MDFRHMAIADKHGNTSGIWSARFDSLAPVLLIIGAVLTTIGFLLSFFYAPLVSGAAVDGAVLIGDEVVTNQLLFSQKIFYFHMPVAIT
ncbi:MAG: hypothetical protein LUB61_05355 [Eggerthellaceae bacterium]|nr:hypothetical protein [Eggerthellaceae bacterium]